MMAGEPGVAARLEALEIVVVELLAMRLARTSKHNADAALRRLTDLVEGRSAPVQGAVAEIVISIEEKAQRKRDARERS
jgi:hypothetical protein